MGLKLHQVKALPKVGEWVIWEKLAICNSAAPISGPFDALIDDSITFDASIKKPKFGKPKKGWGLVCFQSNQTKEEVIFRKINMEQFLSQNIALELLKCTKILYESVD